MATGDNFAADMQALIRKRLAELADEERILKADFEKKRTEFLAALSLNYTKQRELEETCTHPNGVREEWHGYPTLRCPDCKLSVVFVFGDETSFRKRRRKKKAGS